MWVASKTILFLLKLEEHSIQTDASLPTHPEIATSRLARSSKEEEHADSLQEEILFSSDCEGRSHQGSGMHNHVGICRGRNTKDFFHGMGSSLREEFVLIPLSLPSQVKILATAVHHPCFWLHRRRKRRLMSRHPSMESSFAFQENQGYLGLSDGQCQIPPLFQDPKFCGYIPICNRERSIWMIC